MLEHDVQPEAAEAVFRRKLREKLVARGYKGGELERKLEELIAAPVRFRLDLSEEPSAQDLPKP
jgi:hypothetical protein